MLEASGIDAYCGKAASSRLGALRSVSNLGWFSLSSLTNLGIWLKANCWHNEREDSGGNHWLDSESCT